MNFAKEDHTKTSLYSLNNKKNLNYVWCWFALPFITISYFMRCFKERCGERERVNTEEKKKWYFSAFKQVNNRKKYVTCLQYIVCTNCSQFKWLCARCTCNLLTVRRWLFSCAFYSVSRVNSLFSINCNGERAEGRKRATWRREERERQWKNIKF